MVWFFGPNMLRNWIFSIAVCLDRFYVETRIIFVHDWWILTVRSSHDNHDMFRMEITFSETALRRTENTTTPSALADRKPTKIPRHRPLKQSLIRIWPICKPTAFFHVHAGRFYYNNKTINYQLITAISAIFEYIEWYAKLLFSRGVLRVFFFSARRTSRWCVGFTVRWFRSGLLYWRCTVVSEDRRRGAEIVTRYTCS